MEVANVHFYAFLTLGGEGFLEGKRCPHAMETRVNKWPPPQPWRGWPTAICPVMSPATEPPSLVHVAVHWAGGGLDTSAHGTGLAQPCTGSCSASVTIVPGLHLSLSRPGAPSPGPGEWGLHLAGHLSQVLAPRQPPRNVGALKCRLEEVTFVAQRSLLEMRDSFCWPWTFH